MCFLLSLSLSPYPFPLLLLSIKNEKARRRLAFLSSLFMTPSHRRRHCNRGPSLPPLSPDSPQLPRVLGDRPKAPLDVGTIQWGPMPLRSPSEARPLHRINHVTTAPQTHRVTREHTYTSNIRARKEKYIYIYKQINEFPFGDARDNSSFILSLSSSSSGDLAAEGRTTCVCVRGQGV